MPNKVTLNEHSTISDLKKAVPRSFGEIVHGVQLMLSRELNHSVEETNQWSISEFGSYAIGTGVLETPDPFKEPDYASLYESYSY